MCLLASLEERGPNLKAHPNGPGNFVSDCFVSVFFVVGEGEGGGRVRVVEDGVVEIHFLASGLIVSDGLLRLPDL